MATSVTQSLFGITPQSIQNERDAALQQQALQFAKLDPFQAARMGLFQGASQLGTGIAGALGYEDPEIAQARQRQGMLGGLNVADPAALRQAAQNADPQTASLLVTRAMELEKGSAEIEAQQALVNQRNREARTSFGNDREAIAKELYNKSFNDLTSVEAAAVNKKATEVDIASKKAGATKVSVGAPDIKGILQEVGAKEDAKGKAENWAKAGDAYKMQVPMLAQLDEVTQLLPRTFTGSFANTSLQFGKALSGLGIPIDETKLTNTEYLNAVSAQLLQTIARNFPGALAVKEMDQLIKSKPNSQQQVTTIVKILDGLKKEMKSNVIAYEQLAKLPESERYGKNFNLVQADAFRKLTRYESLVKKAQQAKADTSGKTRLTKEEIAEAQSLQQELGEK
jgi:hypothetical protein